MNKKLHFLLLTSLTLLVMVVSAVQPMVARADDSTPVAPSSPAAVDTSAPVAATSVAPADTSVAPADTSVAPADTSVAPVDTSVAPADTSVPPTSVAPTDTSAAATTVAPTDATVAPTDTTVAPTDTSTLVGSVPTDTTVVVLDATGTPVPLATATAASIVNNTDPVWCEGIYDGSGSGYYLPGSTGHCTTTGSTRVTQLISAIGSLNDGSPASGKGTVYFEYTDSSSPYNTTDATFDQSNTALASLTDLEIEGGWNGGTNSSFGISGSSYFSVPLTIWNSSTGAWNGNVTINNIIISDAAGDGLTVNATGNITVNNVQSNHNHHGNGASLNNTAGGSGKQITVTNSVFGNSTTGGNDGDGLDAFSQGSITLSDVTADYNYGDGAYLNNALLDPIIANSQFNGNGFNGLEVLSSGDVKLTNVTADGNGYDGALLGYSGFDGDSQFYDAIGGSITVTGGDFSNNYGNGDSADPAGLEAYADGGISLSGVTADFNGTFIGESEGSVYPADGAYLDNCLYDGDYCSSLGEFESLGADVIVSNSTFGEFYLPTPPPGYTGPILAEPEGNSANGLEIYSGGDVNLTGVSAETNNYDGAKLGASSLSSFFCHIFSDDIPCEGEPIGGSVKINKSEFSSNSDNNSDTIPIFGDLPAGLEAYAFGGITLTGVTADGNGVEGATLDNSDCFFEGFPICFGDSDIKVDNTSGGEFSGNGTNEDEEGGDGLAAISIGTITLNGVIAEGNYGNGALLENDIPFSDYPISGDIVVSNSTFGDASYNRNGSDGLDAYSLGEITLTDVTADYNYYNGADLSTGLDPTITNSHFDNNGGDGLYIDTSNNNADTTINCSTANGNGNDGLDITLGNGTLTLNGVITTGNDNNLPSNVVNNPNYNCQQGGKGKGPVEGVGSLPWNVINVPDGSGQGNPLSCSQYVGTDLVLPNGDHALLPCPIGSVTGTSGSISRVSSNKLPGTALDSRFTFVSAFDVEVNPSLSGGMVTVSFKIPAGKQGANFTILHWDGTKWVKMGGSINPPGYFSVATNLTGDFVLVTQ